MSQHIAMASNGRLVIPASVRAELGMQAGGRFIVHVEDGHIRLEPIQMSIARAGDHPPLPSGECQPGGGTERGQAAGLRA